MYIVFDQQIDILLQRIFFCFNHNSGTWHFFIIWKLYSQGHLWCNVFDRFRIISANMSLNGSSFLSIRLLSTKWKCQRDHYSLRQKIFPYYMSSSRYPITNYLRIPHFTNFEFLILNYNFESSELLF